MPDWIDDLNDFAMDAEWEEEGRLEIDGPPPDVQDLAGAARLARRIARLERDAEQIAETAKSEMERIQRWAEDRMLGIDKATIWLERGLRSYMESVGARTTSLPAGTARLRPPRPRIEIGDKETFIEWVEANERYDLVRKEPSKSAIADAEDLDWTEADSDDLTTRYHIVTPDGEVVPGIERVVGKIATFSFNPTKESLMTETTNSERIAKATRAAEHVTDAFDVLHEAIKQCNLALMNLASLARDPQNQAVWKALDANFEAVAMTCDIGREVCDDISDRRRLMAVDGDAPES